MLAVWVLAGLTRVAQFIVPILLDATVKGALVLLGAWLVTSVLMRRGSAAARHLVWSLALASLLFLPLFSGVLPQWQVLPSWLALRAEVDEAVPAAVTPPPARPAPLPSTPIVVPEQLLKVIPEKPDPAVPDGIHRITAAGAFPLPPAPSWTPPALPAAPPPAPAAVAVPAAEPPLPLSFWLVVAWLAGGGVTLAPLALSYLKLRRLERAARLVETGPWAGLLRQALSDLQLDRAITLLQASGRCMPMQWGIRRPRVLLPAESDYWEGSQQRLVLLHELAHVKRWDCLWQLLGRVVCTIFWFNPLAWLAAGQMQVERERACDDLVLVAGAKASAYAEQLLQVAAQMPRVAFGAAAIAMARPSKLEGRLLAILDTTRNRRGLTLAATILSLLVLASLVLPLSMLRAQDPAPDVIPDPTPVVPGKATPSETATPALVVTDSRGKPLAGASVTVVGLNPQPTDAAGRFTLPPLAPNDVLRLEVSAPGFISREDIQIVRRADGTFFPENLRVLLYRAATLSGRVLGPDGRPLAYAPLSLTTRVTYPNTSALKSNHLRAITDDQGHFVMEDVPPGTHALCYPWGGPIAGEVSSGRWKAFTKPGEKYPSVPVKGRSAVLIVAPADGQHVNDLTLDLSKSVYSVEGRVTDPAGRPLAGATVSAVLAYKIPNGTANASLTGSDNPGPVTDAAGRYVLRNLPPGTLQIVASHANYQRGRAAADVTLDAERVSKADLRFTERYDWNYDPAKPAGFETAESLRSLTQGSYGLTLPPYDKTFVDFGDYIFLNLSPMNFETAYVHVKDLGLGPKPSPESAAAAARSGDFYFRAPGTLVPLNGCILLPLTLPGAAPNVSFIDRIRSMARSELVDQIADFRSTHAAPASCAVRQGDTILAVRSDGRAAAARIDSIDASGVGLHFFYVGILQVAAATQPAATLAAAKGVASQTVRDLLAARPAPKIEDLARRSRPTKEVDDASESFWDILKLRETKDAKAVPVLAEILAGNAGSGQIHGYAAAQALFMIDTAEAREALGKHLLSEESYQAEWIFKYAFHWEMPEPQRTQFIEQYCLKNTAKDLAVRLEARPGEAADQVRFTVIVKNTSDQALSLPDQGVYLARMLYLKTPTGYANRMETTEYKRGMPKWSPLAAGQERRYEIVGKSRSADALRGTDRLVTPEVALVLETYDMRFYLPRGEVQAVALWTVPSLTPEQKKTAGVENAWSGRAVSKAIAMPLGAASQPATSPASRPAAKLAADPVAAVRAVLPKGWTMSVQENATPAYRPQGQGRVFVLVSGSHPHPKQQYDALVYLMPPDYEDGGEDPTHGQAMTWPPRLITATPETKVYLWGETGTSARGWPALKEDILGALFPAAAPATTTAPTSRPEEGAHGTLVLSDKVSYTGSTTVNGRVLPGGANAGQSGPSASAPATQSAGTTVPAGPATAKALSIEYSARLKSIEVTGDRLNYLYYTLRPGWGPTKGPEAYDPHSFKIRLTPAQAQRFAKWIEDHKIFGLPREFKRRENEAQDQDTYLRVRQGDKAYDATPAAGVFIIPEEVKAAIDALDALCREVVKEAADKAPGAELPGATHPDTQPATTQSVTTGPAATQATGEWGKDNAGVQARLRADKGAWAVGQMPTFRADIRNRGQGEYSVAQAQELCQLELDGTRFRWTGDIDVKSSFLPPGRSYSDIPVTLKGSWSKVRVLPDGRTDGLVGLPVSVAALLTPGRHTLHVMFFADGGSARKNLVVESNTVEFEIAAAGHPGDGPRAETAPNTPPATSPATQPATTQAAIGVTFRAPDAFVVELADGAKVQIRADREKLARLGLTMEQLGEALKSLAVKDAGELAAAAIDAGNGLKVRLLDVATVEPGAGPAATHDSAWGTAERGLALKLRTDKPRYKVGDKIVLQFVFKNTTNKELKLYNSSAQPTTCQPGFYDAAGKVVPAAEGDLPPKERTAGIIVLGPHQEMEVGVDLARWSLAGLGHPYTPVGQEPRSLIITGRFFLPDGASFAENVWSSSITSGPLTLEITDAAGRPAAPPAPAASRPAGPAATSPAPLTEIELQDFNKAMASLSDPDPRKRSNGALRLELYGTRGPSAVPALIKLLHDPYLPTLGVNQSADWLDIPAARAGAALVAIDTPEAREALLAAVADAKLKTRSQIIVALRQTKDPRIIAAIVAALKDSDFQVRMAAASTIQCIADARLHTHPTGPLFTPAMFEEHADKIRQASEDLKQAIPALLANLKDDNRWVRQQAGFALSSLWFLKDQSVIPALLEAALRDEAREPRGTAVWALKVYRTRHPAEVIPPLIAALSDAKVQANARYALEQITDQELGNDPKAWQQWFAQQQAVPSATQPATLPGATRPAATIPAGRGSAGVSAMDDIRLELKEIGKEMDDLINAKGGR